MTNQSPSLSDRQALEAELELSNRICLRQRLNRLINDPNSSLDEITKLVNLVSKMVKDHLKSLNPEQELALAARKLEVRQQAMALQKAKMESNPKPTSPRDEEATDSASSEMDPYPVKPTAISSKLSALPKYEPTAVTAPATLDKSTSSKQIQNGNPS